MTNPRTKLLHADITQPILRAFFTAHTELGTGFLEAVYTNAVAVLLRQAGLDVAREVPFEVTFHGVTIGRYRADMVVESKVIVEIKTARSLKSAHTAQLLNYLRASNVPVGLLLNFGRTADFRRVISERSALTASHTS